MLPSRREELHHPVSRAPMDGGERHVEYPPLKRQSWRCCAGYVKHLPKNGGFDLFSNLLLEYLSGE
jgi:hypothetical protein